MPKQSVGLQNLNPSTNKLNIQIVTISNRTNEHPPTCLQLLIPPRTITLPVWMHIHGSQKQTETSETTLSTYNYYYIYM